MLDETNGKPPEIHDVEAMTQGNRDAGGRVYEDQARHVYLLIRSKRVPPLEAEELAAEVWFRVLRAFQDGTYPPFKEYSHFIAWLMKIATNLVYDGSRDSSRATQTNPDPGGTSHPGEDEMLSEQRILTMTALHELGKKHKKLLRALEYRYGLSPGANGAIVIKKEVPYKTIAQRTGIKEKQLREQVSRGTKFLKRIIARLQNQGKER